MDTSPGAETAVVVASNSATCGEEAPVVDPEQ